MRIGDRVEFWCLGDLSLDNPWVKKTEVIKDIKPCDSLMNRALDIKISTEVAEVLHDDKPTIQFFPIEVLKVI